MSQYADLARLSRDLVTIRRDVPLDLDLDALRVRPPDAARLAELFGELEFRSLIPKLEQLALPRAEPAPRAAPSPRPAPPLLAEGRVVDDPELLAELLARCRAAPLVALDTETTSLDPMRAALVGMSLAIGGGGSWYLPFAHVAPDGELAGGVAPRNLPPLGSEALRPLRALLEDPQVPKAGHNINFGWLVLRRAGVELGGVTYDSMLASFVLRDAALTPWGSWRVNGSGSHSQRTVSWSGRGSRSARSRRCPSRTPPAIAAPTARPCCS